MMLTIIKKDDDEVQPMAQAREKSCYRHKKMIIKKRFRARRLQMLKDPFISDMVREDDDENECIVRHML